MLERLKSRKDNFRDWQQLKNELPLKGFRTVEEVLTDAGLGVNIDAFAGMVVDVSTCKAASHNHAELVITGEEYVRANLNGQATLYNRCNVDRPDGDPQFTQASDLEHFIERLTSLQEGIYLTFDDYAAWSPYWSVFITSLDPELSVEQAFKQHVQKLMLASKDVLWCNFLRVSNKGPFRRDKYPKLRKDEEFVYIMLEPTGPTGYWPSELCRAHLGVSTIPNALRVPARFVNFTTWKNMAAKSEKVRRYSTERSFKEKANESAWFIGPNHYVGPVIPALKSDTPDVLEVASVLMESMTFEEALTAAREV